MRINLHTHSNVSDGTLSPSQLIQKLSCDNVKIVALTDHDKIDGLNDAQKEADRLGIKFIYGIEISTKVHDLNVDFLDQEHNTIHLLGYNFNLQKLSNYYNKKQKEKESRISHLIILLKNSGYKINIQENVKKKTEVANALIKAGYVSSVSDAFNNIINLYYDRHIDDLDVLSAANMIHNCGGIILWAHPFEILYDTKKVFPTKEQIDIIAGKLHDCGVDGIEVYYNSYNEEQKRFLEKIKNKYHFISSAGTDYHGKPNNLHTYIDIDYEFIKEVVK